MRLTFRISAALAGVAWFMVIIFLVKTAASFWVDSRRWDLGEVDDVIVSDDAIFVAAGYNRVYKFAPDGSVLDWVAIRGGPIRITRSGESIIVRYSGDEWALEDPAFRVRDPGSVTASVEHTWWGHPILVVHRPEGTSKAFLQPWYLTLVQGPYPGGAWPAIAIAFTIIARWSRQRLGRVTVEA